MDRLGALHMLDVLSQIKDPDEYRRAMQAAKWESERSGRGDYFSDGFSGALNGEVIDAPWRGEYDMPGNFERGQRMANSMTEDWLLGQGLSHEYKYDPEYGVDAYYQPFTPLGGPAGARHNAEFTEKLHFSGPPDMRNAVLHPNNPGTWDPNFDYVGPNGPPTRDSFLNRGGRQSQQPQRFQDFIWRNISTSKRRNPGFRLSSSWLDTGR